MSAKKKGRVREAVLKLKEIKPHPKNPRRHSSEQVARLAEAIEKFGFTSRILVDEDGFILAGEARFLALKKLGEIETPVLIGDYSEAERLEILFADNALGLMSDYDKEKLFDGLVLMREEFNLTPIGFDDAEFYRLKKELDAGLKVDRVGEIETRIEVSRSITCPACGHKWNQ